jgi:hypothetical protein
MASPGISNAFPVETDPFDGGMYRQRQCSFLHPLSPQGPINIVAVSAPAESHALQEKKCLEAKHTHHHSTTLSVQKRRITAACH